MLLANNYSSHTTDPVVTQELCPPELFRHHRLWHAESYRQDFYEQINLNGRLNTREVLMRVRAACGGSAPTARTHGATETNGASHRSRRPNI